MVTDMENSTRNRRPTNAEMYEQVTNAMLAQLEAGTAPWRRPWAATSQAPLRANGTPYRGINVWILLAENRASRLWLTFKQVKEWGGHVRKGERSTTVYFWKRLRVTDTDDNGTETTKYIPLLWSYRVFNLDQTEEVRVPKGIAAKCQPIVIADPIAEAESICDGYSTASLRHGGDRAYYRWDIDHVQLPERESFADQHEYYGTRFHELAHSTGAESRLNRAHGKAFGDDQYSREELVAEMTAAFLCGEAGLGVSGKRFENSAAYLANWMQALRDDKAAVIVAAGQAQRAADLIMGRLAKDESEAEGGEEAAA